MAALPTIMLLPGIHGTWGLFGPLLKAIPSGYPRVAVGYPCDRALNGEELLRYVDEQTPREGPLVIVGESFSGPVATELAALRGEQVRLLVLAASFVCSPVPRWLCGIGALVAGRGPRPLWLIRRALCEPAATEELVRRIRIEAKVARPDVAANRLRMVAGCDAREELKQCVAPVLYLRGKWDRVVRVGSVEVVRRIRPDVRVVELDCGHLVLQTRAREAWVAIVAAL